MAVIDLPQSLSMDVHMVGIKGTGMTALAEILVAGGASVTGSDTAEHFHTDEILQSLGITYEEGFRGSNIPARASLVIYSAAYDPEQNVELKQAASTGIAMLTYPQALGLISGRMPSIGIAGVHGKTTTAAMCATIVQKAGLPGTVLSGSALANLGGRATLVAGQKFFIAETCEYRRNFLDFMPAIIVVTSIEADHLDYFKDFGAVLDAFAAYAGKLPQGGELIYCADDPGAAELAQRVQAARPDLRLTPYGESASGEGSVVFADSPPGELRFTVGRRPFSLGVPGRHNALNAAAAVIATARARDLAGSTGSAAGFGSAVREAVGNFRGTRRRSEVVGEAAGIMILDDYGHHPTAIARTLDGYREFYPGRRIVLDFMSHTYSRTRALLADFARALSRADMLILHEIYASAREENPGDVSGALLAEAVRDESGRPETVHFVPKVADTLPLVRSLLRSGDIFVTMGAGNNWEIGRALLASLRGPGGSS